MEESKELQGFYKIFRAVIYISVLMEFFEYAIDLAMLDHWGGILIDIHGRMQQRVVWSPSPISSAKAKSINLSSNSSTLSISYFSFKNSSL